MKISVFSGDLCDAKADALCTSTNPRLSLVMGTGASVRNRGGYQILRACEEIVVEEIRRTGRPGLLTGSAHRTIPGDLPAKVIVHCVSSDAAHRTSVDIIRKCVRNAVAVAEEEGCESIALPVFGTGHVGFPFDKAVLAIAEALRDQESTVGKAVIVVNDPGRVEQATELVGSLFPDGIDVEQDTPAEEENAGTWLASWGGRDDL